MSLYSDANKIYINDSSGNVLFDSTHKLVHKKGLLTGSFSLGAGYSQVQEVALPSSYDDSKDFLLITVVVTSGNGNVIDDSLNSSIQLNFPMLCNFTHETTFELIKDYEVMGAVPFNKNGSNLIRFSYINHAEYWSKGSLLLDKPPSTYVVGTYRIQILTYQ